MRNQKGCARGSKLQHRNISDVLGVLCEASESSNRFSSISVPNSNPAHRLFNSLPTRHPYPLNNGHPAFRDGFLEHIGNNFCSEDVSGIQSNPLVYPALKRALVVVWGDAAKDLANDDLEMFYFEAWWAFWFGDQTQLVGLHQGNGTVRGHRCRESTCDNACGDAPGASAKEGKYLSRNLFFRHTVPMYNGGRWTKQIPCLKYFARMCVFSQDAMVHGLKNIACGHRNMEAKRKVRLTKATAIFEREHVVSSLLSSLFVACLLERVVYHLFSQHGVDKGINRRSDRHSSMHSSVKLVNRIVEDLFVLVCGERLANEDFEFMEAMWVVLEAFTPGDRLDQSRHEVSMFLLEIYVELWLKFGIEQDMAPYSYTPMEDLEFDSPAELDGWKTHVIELLGTKDCDLFGTMVQWKRALEAVHASERAVTLRGYNYTLNSPVAKETTMAEEREHAFQKSVAGGFDRWPRGFASQACSVFLKNVRRSYEMQPGHRDLSSAPPSLQTNFQQAVAGHTVHRRPTNVGNPLISKIGKSAARTFDATGKVTARGVGHAGRKALADDVKSSLGAEELTRIPDVIAVFTEACCVSSMFAFFVWT